MIQTSFGAHASRFRGIGAPPSATAAGSATEASHPEQDAFWATLFHADAHTADVLPDRRDNFWFLHFVDSDTPQYGVHWPTLGHSVRFSFGLSRTVETPSTPWGYGGDAP